MTLRLIEPARPGFDVHTFECPKCYETETFVVPISCEINVSIAPAVAGSRAASAFRPGDCSDDANIIRDRFAYIRHLPDKHLRKAIPMVRAP